MCVPVCAQVHGHTHAHLACTRACAPHCACAGDANGIAHARTRVGHMADHYIGYKSESMHMQSSIDIELQIQVMYMTHQEPKYVLSNGIPTPINRKQARFYIYASICLPMRTRIHLQICSARKAWLLTEWPIRIHACERVCLWAHTRCTHTHTPHRAGRTAAPTPQSTPVPPNSTRRVSARAPPPGYPPCTRGRGRTSL